LILVLKPLLGALLKPRPLGVVGDSQGNEPMRNILRARIRELEFVRARIFEGIGILGGCTVVTEVVRNSVLIPNTWLAQIVTICILNIQIPILITGLVWSKRGRIHALIEGDEAAQVVIEAGLETGVMAPESQ